MSSDPRSDTVKHSAPIPINTSAARVRGRSASVSSASSGSASSPSEIQTPMSTSASSGRFGPASPGTSPIFSYFFNQSPTKPPPGASNNTYPFRKFGPPPVFEGMMSLVGARRSANEPATEDEPEKEPPVATHARRASTAVAGRFAQPQPAMPDNTTERGAGLLRRLSLSGAFVRVSVSPFLFRDLCLSFPLKPTDMRSRSPPNAPPNSAISPVEAKLPPFARGGKPRRSATISMDAKPRRAPSPMGERILKGHFDGFN